MQQMGNVAWLASDNAALTKRACGLATFDAIVQEPTRPDSVRAGQGGWLDGLKVLDLTNVIAGPTIGSTLSRFGADVTLVQPVEPSVDPWNAVVFGLHAQRGKRSILVDLGSADGREVLDRLLAEADVVTMNGTDAQRDRLGLSPDRLRASNPRLILVQLDAFGGPARGPKSDHLGYDDLAQAATGVMLRFGGGMETPEEHAHFGTIDALTGHCACVALGAALLQRSRTGDGDVGRAALAAAGNIIQAPFMYDFAARPPFDEPSGRDAKGWGPFYHCYRARDGWMFLAAPIDGRHALSDIAEFTGLADVPDDHVHQFLAARFVERPVAHWAATLKGRSSCVVPLGSLQETRDASLHLESAGGIDLTSATFRAIRHDRHPMGRWVDLPAPNAIRPRNAKIAIPRPAPKYGADTRAILQELGYAQNRIEELLAAGTVAEQWSEKYLPE